MALNNPLKLCIDRQNQVIAAVAGFASSLGQLFQGDLRDFVVQVVDPAATDQINGPQFIPANMANQTMVVTLSSTPVTGDGQQMLFATLNMTWDANGPWFYGQLDLTQANLAAKMGSDASLTAALEICITNAGARQVIYQTTQLTINAPANPGAVVNPQSPNPAMTQAAADNRYAKLLGSPGQKIYLVSEDGNKCVALFVDNNGELQSPAVNPVPQQ